MTARLAWIAAADRTAHAQAPRATRTACGLRTTPERHAWPPERRCAACEALVAQEAKEAPASSSG